MSLRSFVPGAVAVAVCAVGAGCSSTGQYVWFSNLPAAIANGPTDYVINVGDTLDVRVLGHEDVSVLKEKVRVDGRIAIPLIGEVEARGKRPSAFRAELEGRLKDFIVSPSITVNVVDVQPMTLLLLGEVAHPGAFQVDPNVPLAQALALGGGLTDYASRDGIFVVRQQPQMRVRFTYQAVMRNEGRAGEFPLHPGDLVEVE
ncbi:MAG: polysaccharide biosynthesis/export family protein [Polyangiaceae bacterium]